MSIIKWRPHAFDPFSDLLDLQNEMNRLFDTSLDRSVKKDSLYWVLPGRQRLIFTTIRIV